jgi:hypothetical protein
MALLVCLCSRVYLWPTGSLPALNCSLPLHWGNSASFFPPSPFGGWPDESVEGGGVCGQEGARRAQEIPARRQSAGARRFAYRFESRTHPRRRSRWLSGSCVPHHRPSVAAIERATVLMGMSLPSITRLCNAMRGGVVPSGKVRRLSQDRGARRQANPVSLSPYHSSFPRNGQVRKLTPPSGRSSRLVVCPASYGEVRWEGGAPKSACQHPLSLTTQTTHATCGLAAPLPTSPWDEPTRLHGFSLLTRRPVCPCSQDAPARRPNRPSARNDDDDDGGYSGQQRRGAGGARKTGWDDDSEPSKGRDEGGRSSSRSGDGGGRPGPVAYAHGTPAGTP